jgi:hypothetical protein
VTVENRCICTQANVKLACGGFNASMGVDPGILSVDDGNDNLCTHNGGCPISMGPDSVKFSYTWRSQFSFDPVSSTMACS